MLAGKSLTKAATQSISGSHHPLLPGTLQLHTGVLMVVAAPGVGKSVYAMNMVAGRPCVYFSADTLGAIQAQRHTRVAGDPPPYFWVDDRPAIHPKQAEATLLGYRQLFGTYPELIVIDNYLDIVFPGGAEDPEAAMGWLNMVAAKTGATVIVLHHVTAQFNDGETPIPLSGVRGQLARIPYGCVTLAKDFRGLRVFCVKNRYGLAEGVDTMYLTKWKGELCLSPCVRTA